MSLIDEILQSVLYGKSKVTETLVLQALEEKFPPEQILREGMVPAMQNMETEFKSSQMDIPRVLSAARAMQKGLDILEPMLQGELNRSLGTAILGTVQGDLHEVGKNIVAIMFRSAGFRVIDLGVDISEKQFVKAVRENPEVSVVCISSLLTTSLPEMKKIVQALKKYDKQGRLYIMVGGGSVTEEIARQIGADGYTENAAEAASLARSFVENTTVSAIPDEVELN